MLEPEPPLPPLEQRIALSELEVAEGAAAEAEPDHLDADDDQQRPADQRVGVEGAPGEGEVAVNTVSIRSTPSAIITSPGT